MSDVRRELVDRTIASRALHPKCGQHDRVEVVAQSLPQPVTRGVTRHGGRVGDVQAAGPRAARTPGRGGNRGSGLPVDIGAQHVGARADQGPAQRGADTRAPAGDDGGLAGKETGGHGVFRGTQAVES